MEPSRLEATSVKPHMIQPVLMSSHLRGGKRYAAAFQVHQRREYAPPRYMRHAAILPVTSVRLETGPPRPPPRTRAECTVGEPARCHASRPAHAIQAPYYCCRSRGGGQAEAHGAWELSASIRLLMSILFHTIIIPPMLG